MPKNTQLKSFCSNFAWQKKIYLIKGQDSWQITPFHVWIEILSKVTKSPYLMPELENVNVNGLDTRVASLEFSIRTPGLVEKVAWQWCAVTRLKVGHVN